MNSVTVVIFLTSSLGLAIFISAANPVFPWGLASLYTSAWIFQEPRGFPKINETVLFHKSFGGEKIVPCHHSVPCIDYTAAALLLQLVLTGSAWQLDLESGCGSIKTFNKIILKEKKKTHPAVGSWLTFAPRLPLWVQVPQPLRWCTRRLQSESSFVLICILVAQSLLQTNLQHPVWAAGPPSFPLTQRPYVEPMWKPRSSWWDALEALIYLFC